MDVSSGVVIKVGPYRGKTLQPIPFNLLSISSAKDQELVAAVATALILLRAKDTITYLEIDGFDSNRSAWLLCGYGIHNEVSALECARLEDMFSPFSETKGCIVKMETDLDKYSKGTYRGERQRGCFKVWVRAPENKPDYDDIIEFPSTVSDRSDAYMRANRVGIQKKTHKKKKSSAQEIKMAVLRDRGFFTRVLDSLVGVTERDVEEVVDETVESSSL